MILLDTNILIRHAHTSNPAFATVEAALIDLQAKGEDLCVIPQNLYEFWAVATRPIAANGLGLTISEAQKELARIKRLFHLLADLPTLLDEWERVVSTHKCAGRVSFDARLVAAMGTHGVATILTFNGADFVRFPGIAVIDPAALIPSTTPPPSSLP